MWLHFLQISALRKRIQTGRDELKKQRQMELERLLQRYQNVKNELESQQVRSQLDQRDV